MAVVTIDFHNTLIECDRWFELEVRSLPSTVMDWLERHGERATGTWDKSLILAEYRKLRLAVHVHGHELDAVRSVMQVFDRTGIDVDRAQVDKAIEALMREALDSSSPVRGAQRLLAELHDAGASIAIVSSAVYHPFLEWALERHGMREQIDVVVTSASAGYYKSRPEIFWTALDALVRPSNGAVHVGDSLRFDVGGAALAGMRTVWFDRAGSGRPEPSDGHPVPDLIVSELERASGSIVRLSDGSSPSAVRLR
jgi:FMN phosphatase YigB (HAD superfamily)